MKEKLESLVRKLYRVGISTFKDKKVLAWISLGITVYAIPAFYRIFINLKLPFEEFYTFDFGNKFIPKNLPEKLVVNSFAPGGIGAIISEKFFEKWYNQKLEGMKKYFARVFGSFASSIAWSFVQYLGRSGYLILDGKWFEPFYVYPVNYLIALTLAPLATYAMDKIYEKLI
ncbi:MAG: hypothetical protein B6U78_01750 [Candidatus Aenigmarchaeota archaeon ex4484_224]|nr:MAG: hypothetical protein B6U78_01750 [Candidatus Aenigmarchaeota archaeon ex4484_224]